jgi:hypothetical protein
MALKQFTTGEMITISEPWIRQGSPQRKALAALPELEPVLTKVEQAHEQLLATQPSPAAQDARRGEADKTDARHDHLARASDTLMTGFTLAAETEADAQSLANLHAVLLPNGLTIVQRSYREEAGEARMLHKRLTDEHRALLKDLPLPGKRNLLQLVEEWIATGMELGRIEDARAAQQPAPEATTAADVVRARNTWIRAVNALMSMADLHEVSASTKQLLFQPLWDTDRSASRRRGKKPSAEGALAAGGSTSAS